MADDVETKQKPITGPLERYIARHPGFPNGNTPDEHLLLLSIAMSLHRLLEINEEMLIMGRESQEAIRAFNDMNNTTAGDNDGQHEHVGGTD